MTAILSLLFILLFPAPGISLDCIHAPCKIIALDAPFRETVYDLDRYLKRETNADAVKEIVQNNLKFNLKVITIKTSPSWLNNGSKFKEVIGLAPDVIVMHTSTFYSPRGVQITIDNLQRSLKYFADHSTAEILLYGSHFTPLGGLDRYKKFLIRMIPGLKGRFTLIQIPSRTFKGPKTEKTVISAMRQIFEK